MGKVSERELVRILGPEKALNIIEAKKITEKSIKRAIDEYTAIIMLKEAKKLKS